MKEAEAMIGKKLWMPQQMRRNQDERHMTAKTGNTDLDKTRQHWLSSDLELQAENTRFSANLRRHTALGNSLLQDLESVSVNSHYNLLFLAFLELNYE